MRYYNINSSKSINDIIYIDIDKDLSKHYHNDYDMLASISMFYQESWISEIVFKLFVYQIYKGIMYPEGYITFSEFCSKFDYYLNFMKRIDNQYIGVYFEHLQRKFNTLRNEKYMSNELIDFPFINIHVLLKK